MKNHDPVLGVRMPVELKQQIEKLARADDRTASSWVRTELTKVVRQSGKKR